MRDISCFPYLRSSQVHRGYPGAETSDSQCPEVHRGLHHRTSGTDESAVAVSAAVLSSARRSEKFAYMIGAILVVYVLPATDAWTYGAWAAALALFLQLRTIEDRILLSVFALGVYVWTLQTQQTAPPAQ